MNDPEFDVWGIRGAAQALWFFGVIWIVLAAVLHYWAHANYGMTVASALLFPVTFLVYPWTHVAVVPLWTVFLAASGLYLLGSIREGERVAPAEETERPVRRIGRQWPPRRRIAGSGLPVAAGQAVAAWPQGLAPSVADGSRDVDVDVNVNVGGSDARDLLFQNRVLGDPHRG
jgi:hypothetical protein